MSASAEGSCQGLAELERSGCKEQITGLHKHELTYSPSLLSPTDFVCSEFLADIIGNPGIVAAAGGDFVCFCFLFVFVCLFLLLLLFFGASGLTFAPYLNEECNYQSC